MSRHEFTAPGVEAVIGWDRPLNTYFAQVWDRTKDEDDPAAELVWIGCMPGEIHDPQTVIAAVRRHVNVPADLVNTLYAEAHA